MANITASDVKELREMTGCGMMDCKRALVEADGNRDEAVKILREKGLAKAAKKAGRIAAEGIVKAKVNGTNGVIVEINCETDFCARATSSLSWLRPSLTLSSLTTQQTLRLSRTALSQAAHRLFPSI